MIKEAKGGAFATADMKTLKRALYAYTEVLRRTPLTANTSDELSKVANLLHRINRIA